ncbi:hypothetical protein [Bacteroides sp. 51]|uniref:hypothetical protein n=1 Tax=Bacteroides sp. 51 TaxID=2302938 RepID=UPI0019403111|nr:hypothetical protein [Bacteroides sp. 51]NDV83764.1 hypothetical protein [Bacteroides sp. 51]
MPKFGNKRSIATYSASERRALQAKAAANATASKAAAENFLKKAGILTQKGEVSAYYSNKSK